MKKIVVNRVFGGFNLSKEAKSYLNKESFYYEVYDHRSDEDLVFAVENLGSHKASGDFAKLCVAEIPDEATDWMIIDYDGLETVYYVVDGKIERCSTYKG